MAGFEDLDLPGVGFQAEVAHHLHGRGAGRFQFAHGGVVLSGVKKRERGGSGRKISNKEQGISNYEVKEAGRDIVVSRFFVRNSLFPVRNRSCPLLTAHRAGWMGGTVRQGRSHSSRRAARPPGEQCRAAIGGATASNSGACRPPIPAPSGFSSGAWPGGGCAASAPSLGQSPQARATYRGRFPERRSGTRRRGRGARRWAALAAAARSWSAVHKLGPIQVMVAGAASGVSTLYARLGCTAARLFFTCASTQRIGVVGVAGDEPAGPAAPTMPMEPAAPVDRTKTAGLVQVADQEYDAAVLFGQLRKGKSARASLWSLPVTTHGSRKAMIGSITTSRAPVWARAQPKTSMCAGKRSGPRASSDGRCKMKTRSKSMPARASSRGRTVSAAGCPRH